MHSHRGCGFRNSPLLRRHRLLIVGDGPERESLPRADQEPGPRGHRRVTRQSSHDEVPSSWGSADVFVFPSIRESGGLVVAERWRRGWPRVVTDYGGPGKHPDRRVWNQNSPSPARKSSPPDSETNSKALAMDRDLRSRLGAGSRGPDSPLIYMGCQGQDDPRGLPVGAGASFRQAGC